MGKIFSHAEVVCHPELNQLLSVKRDDMRVRDKTVDATAFSMIESARDHAEQLQEMCGSVAQQRLLGEISLDLVNDIEKKDNLRPFEIALLVQLIPTAYDEAVSLIPSLLRFDQVSIDHVVDSVKYSATC